MKKLIKPFLSLMAMVLVATSCSESDDQKVDPEVGASAQLVVKFDNPATRSSGTASTDEDVITSGTILVFRSGSGILDGRANFTSIAAPTTVGITAGTRDVYVVANATGTDFGAVQNVADLKNMTAKYAYASINQTGANLPMSGVALNQNATAATVANPTAVTVAMEYMVSKVTIEWELSTTNTDIDGLTITDAYLLNVPVVSDCFDFSPDDLTSYSTGYQYGRASITGFSGSYLPASPAYTNVRNADLDLTPVASGGNFFYIFENKITASPTIVVVEGDLLDPHTNITTTYFYPIVINGTQNTSGGDGTASVVRGKYYTVKATINGLGNTDPYEPILPAAMNVTITAPAWTPALIEQTFN